MLQPGVEHVILPGIEPDGIEEKAPRRGAWATPDKPERQRNKQHGRELRQQQRQSCWKAERLDLGRDRAKLRRRGGWLVQLGAKEVQGRVRLCGRRRGLR